MENHCDAAPAPLLATWSSVLHCWLDICQCQIVDASLKEDLLVSFTWLMKNLREASPESNGLGQFNRRRAN